MPWSGDRVRAGRGPRPGRCDRHRPIRLRPARGGLIATLLGVKVDACAIWSTTWVFASKAASPAVPLVWIERVPARPVVDDVLVQRGPDGGPALGGGRGGLHERRRETRHGHLLGLEHVPVRRIGRGRDGVVVRRHVRPDGDRRVERPRVRGNADRVRDRSSDRRPRAAPTPCATPADRRSWRAGRRWDSPACTSTSAQLKAGAAGSGRRSAWAWPSATASARTSEPWWVSPSRSPRASRTAWPWPWRVGFGVGVGVGFGVAVAVGTGVDGGLDLDARSRHRDDHVVVPVTEHERVAAPLDQRGTLERLEEGRLLGHDVVGADLAGGREPADADQVPVGAVGAVVRVAPARPADVRDPEHRRQLGPADRDRLRPRGSGKGVHHPRPEQGVPRSGVEHEDRLTAVAVDRERVGADPVEPAVVEDGQVRRLEGHRRRRRMPSGSMRAARSAGSGRSRVRARCSRCSPRTHRRERR